MNYIVRGEKIDITDSMKKYVIDKVSKLEKYYDNTSNIDTKILASVRGNKQKVEITVLGSKDILRVEVINNDFYSASDLAIDKLERQLKKYKSKSQKHRKVKEELSEEILDEVNDIIKKRKEIFLKPMTEEEAVTQMELLGHTFFVFKSMETNNTNILYKRYDKSYGLIEVK